MKFFEKAQQIPQKFHTANWTKNFQNGFPRKRG